MNALNKDWKESHDRKVFLPRTYLEAFTIYVKWLYTSFLYTAKDDDDYQKTIPDTPKIETRSYEWNWLRDCYVLGDILQDVDFRDAIIDAFIERIIGRKRYPILSQEQIYPYSSKESPHRKLAQDITISLWHWQDFERLRLPSTPPELAPDVFVTLSSRPDTGLKARSFKQFFEGRNICQTTSAPPAVNPAIRLSSPLECRDIECWQLFSGTVSRSLQ